MNNHVFSKNIDIKNKDRKRNRLKDFNYSGSGNYFITICTRDREKFFGNIINGKMILNTAGKIAKEQWLWMGKRYDFIKLDNFVIMPNHIHGIIRIEKNDFTDVYGMENVCRDNPRVVPTMVVPTINTTNTTNTIYNRQKNLLSKSICAFKTTSSKLIHVSGLTGFKWQRSFYDHIIRNEKSLIKIRNYIKNNPLNWKNDSENIKVIKKSK